jgi:hypothetical protein
MGKRKKSARKPGGGTRQKVPLGEEVGSISYMTLTCRDDQTPLSLVCSVITTSRLRLGWIEKKVWRNSCAECVISGIRAKLIVC